MHREECFNKKIDTIIFAKFKKLFETYNSYKKINTKSRNNTRY